MCGECAINLRRDGRINVRLQVQLGLAEEIPPGRGSRTDDGYEIMSPLRLCIFRLSLCIFRVRSNPDHFSSYPEYST